jgi:hypothetical protein
MNFHICGIKYSSHRIIARLKLRWNLIRYVFQLYSNSGTEFSLCEWLLKYSLNLKAVRNYTFCDISYSVRYAFPAEWMAYKNTKTEGIAFTFKARIQIILPRVRRQLYNLSQYWSEALQVCGREFEYHSVHGCCSVKAVVNWRRVLRITP